MNDQEREAFKKEILRQQEQIEQLMNRINGV